MRESDILKAVGAKVREFRLEAGLTQEELAELVKLSRDSIGNVERGTVFLSARALGDLAEVLKHNVEEFFATVPRVRKSGREAKIDAAFANLRAMMLSGEPVNLAAIGSLLQISARADRTGKATKPIKKPK